MFAIPTRRLLAILALLLLLPILLPAALLFAQDSAAVAAVIPGSAGVFGIAYILSNVVPEIGALLTKQYNAGQGWYASLPNWQKSAVYMLGTMLVMTIFQAVGLVFDPEVEDIRSLGAPTITNFIHSLFVTLMVKLGISSGKEKAPELLHARGAGTAR